MHFYALSQVTGRVPIALVQVLGNIHLGNANELESALRKAYAGGARHFLIDLSETRLVTSAGLRVLIALYRLLQAEAAPAEPGKRVSPYLKVLKPTPHVRQVLVSAGLTEYIAVFDDLQTAIDAF